MLFGAPTSALLVLLAAACGGAPAAKRPLRPFIPPPPLAAEPEAPADLPGRAWLDAVHARLHPRWADSFLEQCRQYLTPRDKLNQPALEVTLRMVVERSGAIRRIDMVSTSGEPAFDAAAREVVGDAAPLPPPGDAVLSDDGVVYLDWRFARDRRQDGVAGAKVDRRLWPAERAIPKLLADGRVVEAAERVAAAAEAAPGDDSEAKRLTPLARDVAATWLLAALADEKDPARRIAAARAFAASPWPGAREALRALARDAPDLGLETAAMSALGALHDAAMVEPLLAAVRRLDGTSAAAAAALAVLGRGDEVWRALQPQVGGGDAQQRAVALAALADAAVPESVPALAALLADRRAARADRVAAAVALGPQADGARALAAALGDGDAAVRAAAASGLGRGPPAPPRQRFEPVAALLRDRDPRVRAAAVAAVVRLDPTRALAGVAEVAGKAREPEVLVAAAGALADLRGADARNSLERLAQSKSPEVRLAALRALAQRNEPESFIFLNTVAADPDPLVRAIAVVGLADPSTALGDPAAEVRAAAVAAVVPAGGTAALAAALHAFARARSTAERDLLGAALLLATRAAP